MTGTVQRRSWISGSLRTASTALALAAVLVTAVVVAQSAQAQTFTLLHPFTGYPTDGAAPYAGLVMDAKGNLYGTTMQGGVGEVYGTVFKLAGKKETVLHSFTGAPDGAGPIAGLVMDANGNLYGTTYYGGGPDPTGTVFKVSKSGKETVLYSFCAVSGCADGESPYAGLVMDAKGNLYGTTTGGGASGAGTVFKVTSKGKETVLYSFTGGPDGAYPYAGLVMDAKGNLYGTTYGGGKGDGTVFKVTKTGKETVLYGFAGSPDGKGPEAGLVMDAKGNLYGTTVFGGASNSGTAFKVSSKGKETVLHSFAGGTDGATPYAGLVMDAKGNLYGTTYYGGTSTNCYLDCGTVFKVSSKGKETVLYSFTGGTDGAYPYFGFLVMDAKGNLYGTAYEGGSSEEGTVWKLTP
jgi:uncharacterized repeat protein (TIGR03803 family)